MCHNPVEINFKDNWIIDGILREIFYYSEAFIGQSKLHKETVL